MGPRVPFFLFLPEPFRVLAFSPADASVRKGAAPRFH
jgi:hypothetical protein